MKAQSNPSMPPRRRWLFRVSLRTLFVVVTLAAIWLSVVYQRVRDQRAAVARIEQLGGTIRYDYESDGEIQRVDNSVPPGRPWLRRLLGQELFQDVVAVRLNGSKVTDDDLRLIGKLRRLSNLSLDNTAVDDEGLRHLHKLQNLSELYLWQTRVTSRGLASIQNCSQLTYLMLKETRVDDTAVGTLTSLHQLVDLDVSGTDISGPGLLQVRDALPNCALTGDMLSLSGRAQKKYDIPQWPFIAKQIIALDGKRRLKLLDLSWSNLGDEHLLSLHSLKAVEVIDLRGSEVTTAGAEALRTALPHCDVRH